MSIPCRACLTPELEPYAEQLVRGSAGAGWAPGPPGPHTVYQEVCLHSKYNISLTKGRAVKSHRGQMFGEVYCSVWRRTSTVLFLRFFFDATERIFVSLLYFKRLSFKQKQKLILSVGS